MALPASALFHAGWLYWLAICGVAGAIIYVWLRWDDPLRMGDDEAPDDGSRGDCYLAQELRRHASGPRPDHIEIRNHDGGL